jgi:hypothetical protein
LGLPLKKPANTSLPVQRISHGKRPVAFPQSRVYATQKVLSKNNALQPMSEGIWKGL